MNELPTRDEPVEDPDLSSNTGGAPGGGEELGDDVAKEAQTGISSPDADDHAGADAPASEGQAPV